MGLTELTENEAQNRIAVGKPVQITVPLLLAGEGAQERYSKSIRRAIRGMRPDNANAYIIENQGRVFEAEVKVMGDIIGGAQIKKPVFHFPTRMEYWSAHAVQYFQ